MPINYNKPALSVEQQIDLLESRGLNVSDRNRARHYLQFINYYHLSGYSIYFEQVLHQIAAVTLCRVYLKLFSANMEKAVYKALSFFSYHLHQ